VIELIVFYFNPSSCRASPLMSKMSKIDFARLPDHHIFTGYGGQSSICLCTGNIFKQVHISWMQLFGIYEI
jgi:hypothetical protein